MSLLIKTLFGVTLSFVWSCHSEEPAPDVSEKEKRVQWEVFYQAEPEVVLSSFAISDDATWLFYTDNLQNI